MGIEQLYNIGQVKTFKTTGGDGTITISAGTVLTTGSGRQSSRVQLRAFPRTLTYYWEAKGKFASNPTLGAAISLYWSHGNATPDHDGDLGITDAAIASTDKYSNLKQFGQILVDVSNTSSYMKASGICSIPALYVVLVVRNQGGQSMNDFELTLTELIPQTVAS